MLAFCPVVCSKIYRSASGQAMPALREVATVTLRDAAIIARLDREKRAGFLSHPSWLPAGSMCCCSECVGRRALKARPAPRQPWEGREAA